MEIIGKGIRTKTTAKLQPKSDQASIVQASTTRKTDVKSKRRMIEFVALARSERVASG